MPSLLMRHPLSSSAFLPPACNPTIRGNPPSALDMDASGTQKERRGEGVMRAGGLLEWIPRSEAEMRFQDSLRGR